MRTAIAATMLLGTAAVYGTATGDGQLVQSTAAAGMIAGRVVDEISGRGVRGARVTLWPTGDVMDVSGETLFMSLSDARARRQGMTESQTLTTPDTGTFEFAGIASGVYQLTVDHPSYLRAGFGRKTSEGHLRAIRLAAGQRLTGLQIAVGKPAVLEGRVTDERGEPQTAVEVRALRRERFAGAWRFARTAATFTDDRGIYRFTTLLPGDYAVAVPSATITAPSSTIGALSDTTGANDAQNLTTELIRSGAQVPPSDSEEVGLLRVTWRGPGGGLVRTVNGSRAATGIVYPTTYYPSASTPAQALLLRLESSSSSTADIQVSGVPSVAISGILRDPQGAGRIASLRLLPDGAELPLSNRGFETALTSSDDQGRFQFLGVPPGQYRIVVLIDRNAWAPTPGSLESLPTLTVVGPSTLRAAPASLDEPVLFAEVPVTVDERGVRDIEVTLRHGTRLSGRVVFDETAADELRRIQPQDLFQKVRLTLSAVDTARTGLARGAAVDAQGEFQTGELPPARYFASVRIPGPGWWVRSVVAGGREVGCAALDLTSADVTQVVTLTRVETTLAGSVRLQASAGEIVDATPLVVAVPADVEGWIAAGMNRRCAKAAEASGGIFTLHNLLAGPYILSAYADAGQVDLDDPDFARAVALAGKRIEVRHGPNQAGVGLTVSKR